MMFYAPARGFRVVRERAPLGFAALVAVVAHSVYVIYAQAPQVRALETIQGANLTPALFYSGVIFAAVLTTTLLVAVALAPIVIFVANLFERRASFRLVLSQEYVAVASCLLYAWAAANLVALPLAFIARTSGFERLALASVRTAEEFQRLVGTGADPATVLAPEAMLGTLVNMLGLLLISPFALFIGWAVGAVREVFRPSWLRAVSITLASFVLLIPASVVLLPLLNAVTGSLFLMLFVGVLLRGYISELASNQRARANFRQNLEAATLNPADASAHYNLGLVHLDRREFAEARDRFRRAIEIDPEELDAHYQLGRIDRREGNYAAAIEHFGAVVARDDSHAQNEIWREIGATYLAAGQAAAARDALDRFLERRPSDPEALYLLGRTLATLGDIRGARDLMQRCVEAVSTAPAYKYRMDKRWMTEAQAFLRSQA